MINKSVYKAFTLKGKGEKLSGGQNNSYRFDDVVLKKNDGDNSNINYVCTILNETYSDDYRVVKPIISNNNRYIEDGYIALRYEEGYHDFKNIEETIRISRIFHRDIAHYSIDVMKNVNTQWAIAMDILFRKRDIPEYADPANLKTCLKMMEFLDAIEDKLQIIHGDIGGNILFHDTLPPCIIDFSPCIAPGRMADAIAVVDHIAWAEGNPAKLEILKPMEEYKMYILHAVMFRLLAALCKEKSSKEEFISEYTAYIKVWNYIMDTEI